MKKQCLTCNKEFNASLNLRKYCSPLCYFKTLKGKGNPNYKKGKMIKKDGYILIYKPEHPFLNSHQYVYEHRLVMEGFIGRYLSSKEVVHHINGNKSDNRIENLILFKDIKDHSKHHYEIKTDKEKEKMRLAPQQFKRKQLVGVK